MNPHPSCYFPRGDLVAVGGYGGRAVGLPGVGCAALPLAGVSAEGASERGPAGGAGNGTQARLLSEAVHMRDPTRVILERGSIPLVQGGLPSGEGRDKTDRSWRVVG